MALSKGTQCTIEDAPDGQERVIVGKVVLLEETLTAPLSGAECACYRVAVEGPAPRTKTDIVAERGRAVAFAIEDATGRAIVSADGARASLAKPRARTVGSKPPSRNPRARPVLLSNNCIYCIFFRGNPSGQKGVSALH